MTGEYIITKNIAKNINFMFYEDIFTSSIQISVDKPKRKEQHENVSRKRIQDKKVIFLDRDGTINQKKDYLYDENDFYLEKHVAKAIKKINESEYYVVVITNQSVVARRLCDIEQVQRIHNKMVELLGNEGAYIDDIRFCPHHPDKGIVSGNPLYQIECNCRKPKIGMIVDYPDYKNIDMDASWFIGDTTVDIQTGKNANLNTILLLTGDAGTDKKYSTTPDYICNDLFEAISIIIGK